MEACGEMGKWRGSMRWRCLYSGWVGCDLGTLEQHDCVFPEQSRAAPGSLE
jgi:hypothetical protein